MLYGEYIYMEMLAIAIKLLCSSVIKVTCFAQAKIAVLCVCLLTQDLCLNV